MFRDDCADNPEVIPCWHFPIARNVDADGDWGTAADWNPVRLPGTSDDVGIHTADFHTVTYSTGTTNVHSLKVGNDAFVFVSGGSLNLAAVSSSATR